MVSKTRQIFNVFLGKFDRELLVQNCIVNNSQRVGDVAFDKKLKGVTNDVSKICFFVQQTGKLGCKIICEAFNQIRRKIAEMWEQRPNLVNDRGKDLGVHRFWVSVGDFLLEESGQWQNFRNVVSQLRMAHVVSQDWKQPSSSGSL
ncbi:hypothetical protein OGAPHI_002661 [Ogataea philodendri]|uniref:Uncharacterized protein n=1 Tax=Ogataea philodendri TaxID=1378263 RepID=A0A9P8PBT6_9ASCO|nr:uncharacterized protein OGAPHI_002661 [Ogataea philodendri]KAH3668906.1 hypothetical protein OGAPHI_002661 [Ogataea philodendri]